MASYRKPGRPPRPSGWLGEEAKIQRGPQLPSEAAVAFFRGMESIGCTCEPINWEGSYWERGETCQGCEQWWKLNSLLCAELRLKPWEWPAVEDPETENPYPAGSEAAVSWRPDQKGQARWKALEAAAAAKS